MTNSKASTQMHSILKCEDGLQDGLRFDDSEYFVMMMMMMMKKTEELSYRIVVVLAITVRGVIKYSLLRLLLHLLLDPLEPRASPTLHLLCSRGHRTLGFVHANTRGRFHLGHLLFVPVVAFASVRLLAAPVLVIVLVVPLVGPA